MAAARKHFAKASQLGHIMDRWGTCFMSRAVAKRETYPRIGQHWPKLAKRGETIDTNDDFIPLKESQWEITLLSVTTAICSPFPYTPCMENMPIYIDPPRTPTDRQIWQSHGASGI